MRARPGAASVAELILVTWLFALVLAGIGRFARDQNRLAALQRDRLRFEEAVRTVAVVLGAELRVLAPADVAAVEGDSVRIRAFRGSGAVCHEEARQLHVRYRGHRLPDPAKDSVLVVRSTGEAAFRLSGFGASSACDGALRFDLDDDPGPGGGLVLLFETGAYVLADGALRYRRGDGGRQPLTEPILGEMRVDAVAGGVVVTLEGHPDSVPRLHRALRRVALPIPQAEPVP